MTGCSERVEQYSTLSQVLSQPISSSIQCGKLRYQKYSLFNGYFHIKWYILIKNVILLFYLLRMIQLDHVQLEMNCLVLTSSPNSEWKTTTCTRSVCMWLHHITGLLPRFLLVDNDYVCLAFLFIGVLSCLFLLTLLYWQECGRHGSPLRNQCLSYLLVTPSVLFEAFVMFFCFYGIVMSLEWRLRLWKTPSYWIAVRALIFAALLVIALAGEIILHYIAVRYLCDSPSEYYPVHKDVSSPSESVLEMLKNPLVHIRSNTNVPSKLNGITIMNNKMAPYDSEVSSPFRDSGNITFESSGYGKCRQLHRDRSSLVSAEEVMSRDRPLGFRPHLQYLPGDCGDACGTMGGSDYQQIKPIYPCYKPGRIPISSQNSMDQDTTYLEVV
ncbi:unnamed protein product [Auanema sp. JU1783]|nr:unnamed protein product [Auanema sp. JU1783]